MFRYELIDISTNEEKPGYTDFHGHKEKGTEYYFSVIDNNFVSKKTWEFKIYIPQKQVKGIYTVVVPAKVPNRTMWAGLERRTLTFNKTTLGKYKNRLYATLSASDPSGQSNRKVLSKGLEPLWIKKRFIIAKKCSVTRTKGADGEHPVAVVKKDDFIEMIFLYLALKPWVLFKKYSPEEAREAMRLAKLRQLRLKKNKSIRGLRISITGFLARGTRPDVSRWLERLGAQIQTEVQRNSSILIVGHHYQGEDRKKIRDADKYGIPKLSEFAFRKKYNI